MSKLEANKLRTIVVDDEELARQVLRELLSAHQEIAVVAECRNGLEAVKAVAEHKPDLLFLDVQMPKLTGFDVLELIGPDVPVIFVTGHGDEELRARALKNGATALLGKSFSGEALLGAIQSAVE